MADANENENKNGGGGVGEDRDVTPIEPAIHRSSAQHRLDLHDCPKCEASGVCGDRRPIRNSSNDEPCSLCGGAGKVPLSVATGWILSHSSSPPPEQPALLEPAETTPPMTPATPTTLATSPDTERQPK